jgi:Na+/H+ antiporter NhaA
VSDPGRLVPPPLRLPTPLREYLRNEAAGGVVLMVTAAVALVWANSPWQAAYAALWETWLAVRLGLARLPEATGWAQLAGVATVAGIGFTVPLFVADLAFPDGRFQAPVKLGLLLASVLSGVAGALVLLRTGGPSPPTAARRRPGGPGRGGG